jgi:ABC-type branched-subunit amino acid transport system substrate-binding protein
VRHANVGASPRKLATALVIAILASPLAAPAATAETRYGPGVSNTEIKIGNTMPYSGPLSNVGTQGRTEAAYFKMLNERGGVMILARRISPGSRTAWETVQPR